MLIRIKQKISSTLIRSSDISGTRYNADNNTQTKKKTAEIYMNCYKSIMLISNIMLISLNMKVFDLFLI